MDRRDAETALRLAREWTAEQLMPKSSLGVLEGRYAAEAESGEDESFGSAVLYGLGGVVLGASAFALLLLLDEQGLIRDVDLVAPWLLLAWGFLCFGTALGLDFWPKKFSLADAFHVAALVAITAAAYPRSDDLPLGLFGMVFALVVIAYRRHRFMVPFLAIVAFNVSLAPILMAYVPARAGDGDLGITLWFTYALLQIGTLMLISNVAKWPWAAFSLGAATLLVAGTFVGFFFEVINSIGQGFQGDVEVYLAGLMSIQMVAGFLWREKSAVLAAALVIAIDAIVFAFDVGKIVGGLVAMLAVAALLIWQAGNLRRYLREA